MAIPVLVPKIFPTTKELYEEENRKKNLKEQGYDRYLKEIKEKDKILAILLWERQNIEKEEYFYENLRKKDEEFKEFVKKMREIIEKNEEQLILAEEKEREEALIESVTEEQKKLKQMIAKMQKDRENLIKMAEYHEKVAKSLHKEVLDCRERMNNAKTKEERYKIAAEGAPKNVQKLLHDTKAWGNRELAKGKEVLEKSAGRTSGLKDKLKDMRKREDVSKEEINQVQAELRREEMIVKGVINRQKEINAHVKKVENFLDVTVAAASDPDISLEKKEKLCELTKHDFSVGLSNEDIEKYTRELKSDSSIPPVEEIIKEGRSPLDSILPEGSYKSENVIRAELELLQIELNQFANNVDIGKFNTGTDMSHLQVNVFEKDASVYSGNKNFEKKRNLNEEEQKKTIKKMEENTEHIFKMHSDLQRKITKLEKEVNAGKLEDASEKLRKIKKEMEKLKEVKALFKENEELLEKAKKSKTEEIKIREKMLKVAKIQKAKEKEKVGLKVEKKKTHFGKAV